MLPLDVRLRGGGAADRREVGRARLADVAVERDRCPRDGSRDPSELVDVIVDVVGVDPDPDAGVLQALGSFMQRGQANADGNETVTIRRGRLDLDEQGVPRGEVEGDRVLEAIEGGRTVGVEKSSSQDGQMSLDIRFRLERTMQTGDLFDCRARTPRGLVALEPP